MVGTGDCDWGRSIGNRHSDGRKLDAIIIKAQVDDIPKQSQTSDRDKEEDKTPNEGKTNGRRRHLSTWTCPIETTRSGYNYKKGREKRIRGRTVWNVVLKELLHESVKCAFVMYVKIALATATTTTTTTTAATNPERATAHTKLSLKIVNPLIYHSMAKCYKR